MDKRFPQYDELDLPKVAEEVLKQWEAEDTFGKSLELRKDAPPFVFYEGPPSANGLPGIHHVMARAIKDIFCRYQTQKGHRVDRKAGWDTHGLPIELGVEKELGITKEDIGKKITIAEYNAAWTWKPHPNGFQRTRFGSARTRRAMWLPRRRTMSTPSRMSRPSMTCRFGFWGRLAAIR